MCQERHIPLLSRYWSFFTSLMCRKCFHCGCTSIPLGVERQIGIIGLTFQIWVCPLTPTPSSLYPHYLHSTVRQSNRLAKVASTAIASLLRVPNTNFLSVMFLTDLEKS